jgi:hypothetical protein
MSGAGQDPSVEVDDQVGGFGYGNEPVGQEQAMARSLPTHQGLHPEPRSGDVDERLVMQDETSSALGQVFAQIPFNLVALRQSLLQCLVVDPNALATRLLGLVKSKVGLRQQFQRARVRTVSEGYPDGRPGAEPDVLPLDRL